MKEPRISIAIMSEPQIEFYFSTPYQIWGKYCNSVVTYHTLLTGPQTVTYSNGRMRWHNYEFEELDFLSSAPTADSFELPDLLYVWMPAGGARVDRIYLLLCLGMCMHPARHRCGNTDTGEDTRRVW